MLEKYCYFWQGGGCAAHLGDKVCPSHSRRKLRELVDGGWPANILRHTAASYWLALTGDVRKCATMFGNSPKVFSSHYNGLATPEDARRFFCPQPLPLGPCNVKQKLFPF
jgi:hypothetical protein